MVQARPSDELARSASHLLHRAGQAAGELFQAEVARSDLTARQFVVLRSVSISEGLSQTALVRDTGIDRSTLADIVRRLIKKGLVQRKRTQDDARAYAVRLSEAGRQALRDAEPLALRVDEKLLSALSETQRARFVGCLNTIVEALEQTRREGGPAET
jgi:DNA-binding MarR family transcriptional regulator